MPAKAVPNSRRAGGSGTRVGLLKSMRPVFPFRPLKTSAKNVVFKKDASVRAALEIVKSMKLPSALDCPLPLFHAIPYPENFKSSGGGPKTNGLAVNVVAPLSALVNPPFGAHAVDQNWLLTVPATGGLWLRAPAKRERSYAGQRESEGGAQSCP